MSNLYMPFSAAIISVILLFIYCSKEKVKIKENNIYFAMLIIELLEALSIFFIYFQFNAVEKLSLIKFLNRVDYMALVAWSACLGRYTYVVIHKKDEGHDLRQKIARFVMFAGAIVEAILIWVLRLDSVCEGDKVLTIGGAAAIFTFACCALNVGASIFTIFLNLKKATKQIIPVFIFLIMVGLIVCTYYLDPSVSGVSMGLTIVNLTMYFTIENPDVQMLEAVKFSQEQAIMANQAKTDFLSSMSHEIRTPINAIMGFAECIQNDISLDEAKADAKDIITASDNLLEIINGILDISKIEAGKVEVENKEYDLTDTAQNLAKLIKARIGEKPIELRLNFDQDIPGVLFGDETKLRQIMTNLLTNSVKYTEKGHIDYAIKCDNGGDVATLTIKVTDTGHGIKEEVIDSLFDKFSRLEEDRFANIEGTGLGLAITKQYVEMLNGTIGVHSDYGIGTTFTVKIPQKIVSMEHREKIKLAEIQREYPGRTMLIVDDTAMNLMVAKRLLELYKVDVDLASSGAECIEKCMTNKYDLILLDDMMPRMSGTETLAKMKENPMFNIPVVAFTANAIDGMRDNYIKEGYSDYLSKPLDRSELNRILEKFFRL